MPDDRRLKVDSPAPGPADPPVERLRIERRGGLAGLRMGADCPYADLTAAQQIALRQVLAPGAPRPPSSPGADRFSYRLQVMRSGASDITVELSEDAMPAALAALVRSAGR